MKGSGWVAAAAAGLALLSAGGAVVMTQAGRRRRRELAADPVKRAADVGVQVKAPEQSPGKVIGAPAPAMAGGMTEAQQAGTARSLTASILPDSKREQPEAHAPKLPPALAAMLPNIVKNLGPVLKPAIVSTGFAPAKALY